MKQQTTGEKTIGLTIVEGKLPALPLQCHPLCWGNNPRHMQIPCSQYLMLTNATAGVTDFGDRSVPCSVERGRGGITRKMKTQYDKYYGLLVTGPKEADSRQLCNSEALNH